MNDQPQPVAGPWYRGRSAKQRAVVPRAVKALLDILAPERVLARGEDRKVLIETHRTPKGCVLQAPATAVSVSWFEDDSPALGELHVVLWSGVVTRRGAAAQREAARLCKEMVLAPIDPPQDGALWQAPDGKTFDTAALVTYVSGMLEEEMARTQ